MSAWEQEADHRHCQGQVERQGLALIIDDQVQQIAKKPTDVGLAIGGTPIKDAVEVDAGIEADGQRGEVDKADAGTVTQLPSTVDINLTKRE